MPPVRENVTMSLLLDYEEEELSAVQRDYYKQIDDQVNTFHQRFEELSKSKDVTIENNGNISLIEFTGLTSLPLQQVNSAQKGKGPLVFQPNSNIVVVDPNTLNLVVSTNLQQNAAAGNATNVPVSVSGGVRFTPPTPNAPPVVVGQTAFRGSARGGRFRGSGRGGTAVRQRAPSILKNQLGYTNTATRGGITSPTITYKPEALPPKTINEGESEKGVGYVVDLTDEDYVDDVPDPVGCKADTKEISINKNSEKTFPSLVVVARPHLGPKEFTNQQIHTERTHLDEKVKQVLTLNPPQLTEWLLQHGLLRSEQFCSGSSKVGKHQPLKLGMYSDSSKFPFSGGYVWISDCCPSTFVSVFAGSLFEGTQQPPTVVLKLIYHWACQTAVQNVLQWVKVDNLFVKNLFTNLRAICTAAIHQKFGKLGGAGKRVQIGVISLGTTTQDGTSRQVKVEVLGLLEEHTKSLRIRAIEPLPSDQTGDQQQQMKRRFQKTLELLPRWVDKNSEIVIDFTVDKATLISFGYPKVIQVSPKDNNSSYKIMDYLRKIIPRMFQNTLSLLSRQIIQQFLDELSWREVYGAIPSRAFEAIVQHLGEQTRLNSGGTLLNRLSRISLNPFKNWQYDKWNANCRLPTPPVPKVQAKTLAVKKASTPLPPPPTPAPAPPPSPNVATASKPATPSRPQTPQTQTAPSDPPAEKAPPQHVQTTSHMKKDGSSDPAMIALEPYYYGVLEGDTSKHRYVPFFTQCYICRTDFKNVIKLTDHLILHALNKNLETVSDPKDICRICLKIRLPGSKQHHMQMCQSGPLNPGCRICSMKLKDKGSLVYHMTKTHHQLDMPYQCGKCGYRVSELELLNNHFNKTHHNSISGMCPFCLKIIDFATPGGDDLENNQIFFIKHIQRHVLPSSKKCTRCLLNFVNKSILAAHEVEMHASQQDNYDVMRYLVDDPTLMPAPIMEPPLVHAITSTDTKPTGLLKGISTVLLGVTANVDDGLPVYCHECESPVQPDHFINYLMCNKCSYRTCCSHSMAEHVSLIHPPYPLSSPVYVGMKVIISQKAYCTSCSFSTRDGNLMSSHLITCGGVGSCVIGKRRTTFSENEPLALPPKPRKRRGRKPKSYAEEEEEEEEVIPVPPKQPKTILNSVGLVRKSTDDEASQEPQVPSTSIEIPEPENAEPMEINDDSDPEIDPSASMLEVLVEEPSSSYVAPNVVPTGEISSEEESSKSRGPDDEE